MAPLSKVMISMPPRLPARLPSGRLAALSCVTNPDTRTGRRPVMVIIGPTECVQ